MQHPGSGIGGDRASRELLIVDCRSEIENHVFAGAFCGLQSTIKNHQSTILPESGWPGCGSRRLPAAHNRGARFVAQVIGGGHFIMVVWKTRHMKDSSEHGHSTATFDFSNAGEVVVRE